MQRSGGIIVTALAALGLLAGCSAGGSAPTAPAAVTPLVVAPPAPLVVTGDAVRLAKQASFGPTLTLATHIATVGVAAWIDEQLAASGSSYTDLASRAVARNYCNVTGAPANCARDYLSSLPVAMEFYAHAATGSDQLRQRVAFALSQILVTSDFEVHSTAGLAVYNQLLLDNAFGNYRTLLRAVTLNAYMAITSTWSTAARPRRTRITRAS